MGHHHTLCGRMCATGNLFNSNSVATSAALVEVCALVSPILVGSVNAVDFIKLFEPFLGYYDDHYYAPTP